MNRVLIIDTIWDGESYTDINMTGEQILDYLENNNYNILPILRVIPTQECSLNGGQEQYRLICSPKKVNQEAISLEEMATKKYLYVASTPDYGSLFIDYDTGKILPNGR